MTDPEWTDAVDIAIAYVKRGDVIAEQRATIERLTRELAEVRNAVRTYADAYNACAEASGHGHYERAKHDLHCAERALLRLSPPSAPARDGAERCSCSRRLGDYCPTTDDACPIHGTGKARR